MKLVFCTNNQHKIDEVTHIMPSGFSFLKLKDIEFYEDIPEPYDTLEENSLTKAKTIYDLTGHSAFAEDTGLFIEALNGEPGVKSARYAGEHGDSTANIHKVLEGLRELTNRKAYFKTVVTLIFNGHIHQFSGECHGHISYALHGQDGFGYDPIFIPTGYDITFAEMPAAQKNAISHRKKAFDAFSDFLKTIS